MQGIAFPEQNNIKSIRKCIPLRAAEATPSGRRERGAAGASTHSPGVALAAPGWARAANTAGSSLPIGSDEARDDGKFFPAARPIHLCSSKASHVFVLLLIIFPHHTHPKNQVLKRKNLGLKKPNKFKEDCLAEQKSK
jgi:hypothetical protein